MNIKSQAPPTKPVELNRRVNVCFLIDNLSVAGTENHVVRLIRDLDPSKFNPLLVLLDGENRTSRDLEPDYCPVERLGIRSFFRPTFVSRFLRFKRLLKEHNTDILQLYFPDSTLFGAVTGKLAGVPNLIRTRRNSGYWMNRRFRFRGRMTSRLFRITIANNPASRESVIRQENAPPSSVVVIPNGVDLDLFDSRNKTSRNISEIRVGMLANLRKVKRVDLLIQAAAILVPEFTNLKFEIAGEGPQRNELQQLIDRAGLTDCVNLKGIVRDVPDFLSGLDQLVTCSDSEGLSNTILEAMATGLPVVGSDIPGNRNLIKHGDNGLLFSARDANALADAIRQLCTDQTLCRKLGSSARRFVENHYDQKKLVSKYESLYLSLAADRCPDPGNDF